MGAAAAVLFVCDSFHPSLVVPLLSVLYGTEDPPSKQAQEQLDAEKERPVPIRVMKVMIHANNTFSTLAGLGDTTILRGRFNVIGDQRDQVWMQSLRFGFGRSVSGSTYRYVTSRHGDGHGRNQVCWRHLTLFLIYLFLIGS